VGNPYPHRVQQTYPSRRSPIHAKNVVATSQPLAAQAGLRMLLAGGNAADAAIAAAIALTVVEPCSNGIGSDAFAIVHDGWRLHGLNASGRSPALLTRDVLPMGAAEMPKRGWLPVTVPGAVSAWAALHAKFGKLPFERLFEPAIEYAEHGFAVSPLIADAWRRSVAVFREFPDWMATFAPTGSGPNAGDVIRLPDHARTLRLIAQSKGEAFYTGELADAIAKHARATGGLLRKDDLKRHRADWVDPISTDVHGHRLHEIPPSGQGIAALIALGILRHFDDHLAKLGPDHPTALHLQIEAMRLALADAYAHVADPAHMRCSAEHLLSEKYLERRAALLDAKQASSPKASDLPRGGTVYLAAADASGLMVSFIQSNYWGFGSGIVVPGTGISLQNRGHGFSVDPRHANCVAPRKRPFHTIIPGFLTRADGSADACVGVMGGAMQAQGHVQVTLRMLRWGQDPQTALDAPRWRVLDGVKLMLEAAVAKRTRNALAAMGHEIVEAPSEEFGGGQIIRRGINGHYVAGSDWRKDGQAVGF
jgi:gamma-glutamyltranspeptidase/glutathione hydrolase